MKKLWSLSLYLLALSMCIPCSLKAQSVGDELIFPDINRKFVVVSATSSGQQKLCGTEMAPADSMAALVRQEILMPFNWQMVRMSQCARNLIKNNEGPNILYLSKNEGGFPRTGIWLTDLNGKETHYPDLAFVDLVLDKKRIDQGDMSIYTHELGHVMMDLILGQKMEKMDQRHTSKQHVSMGVTDYLTAFSEGWGIHFQRLAYDQTEKYRKSFESSLTPERALNLAWHSGMDQYMRLTAVKDNGYIYEKFTPCGQATESLDTEQRILLEHTSPAFDHTRIKNAQQMLSCEGVLATIFYQVNSDQKLAGNYLNSEFYTPFLVAPIPAGTTPQQIFSPVENMMLKNFWIWSKMNDMDITGSPLMVWIESWCNEFPDDRDQILKIFIRITDGVTVSPELAQIVAMMNYSGQVGEMQEFQSQAGKYRESILKMIGECKSDLSKLTKNIGPELWVTSKTVKIRQSLWRSEPKNPLSVNLNTASLPEMQAFMDPGKAIEFIRMRKESGYFISMEQVKQFGFLLVK
ncbi:MAG: hypothetical protein PHY99_03285 [Bacteroidales bacterium]|nr:hypothetical protein [Bacteroidales bacterium]